MADVRDWIGGLCVRVAERALGRRPGYVVLYYHRLAGEMKPGQERLDVPPGRFAEHLETLKRAGFTAVGTGAIQSFHRGMGSLPPRSFAVTIDDGFADCLEPLRAVVDAEPQLFVCTDEVGGRAWWTDGEPLADWPELRELADSGVSIGSHATSHHPLTGLPPDVLRAALEKSRAAIRERLGHAGDAVAYPHGRHDTRVLDAVRAASYRLAFTTDPGRNDAGTDPLCIRRVGPKAWDGKFGILWKASTGRGLPAPVERLQVILWRLSSYLRLRARSPRHGA